MNTNLLKEAIAEADAIKKMAIENAKSSLNEAFDSKIKSMMAARLEEEADDFDLEEEYEEGYEDQDEAKHKEPDGDEPDGDEGEMEEEYGADDADEAFDLDKILAELEGGDLEAEEEVDNEVMEEKGEDDDSESPKEDDDDEKEEEEPMDEEIDIAALLAEMDDDKDDEVVKEEEKNPEEDEKTLEEEMMSLLERMKEKKMAKAAKMKKKEEDEKPESKELQEIKRQAAELTQKVNETNLINAKLLYLNKILRKYNLSEQQKIKVISAFDKAQTVNESKIVHESLDQAFSVKNDNVKTGLKESIGFASSAAGNSTKRVINEGVVSDVDKQVSRWQKLAGIIK